MTQVQLTHKILFTIVLVKEIKRTLILAGYQICLRCLTVKRQMTVYFIMQQQSKTIDRYY